jgi:hypothetical protein
VNETSVLIVSDDPEFARTVASRWQSERHVPGITIVNSGLWQTSSSAGYDLAIIGSVREDRRSAILASANNRPGSAVVCLADERDIPALHADYPNLVVVPMQDGWAGTLILVSVEALRRMEALSRTQHAERQAVASQGHAILGRYMLEVRPSVNDALTSVLGNADLLLLEPGQIRGECREQIQAIHTMALRLNEIMQRFSSLAAEMRLGEKESQAETEVMAGPSMSRA